MKINKIIGMAVFMLLMIVPGALAWTVSGTVYFTVDSSAVPAAGVDVNLTEIDGVTLIAQTTTAADGTYSFTTASIPPPPKIVTAFILSQSKTVSKPTNPTGNDQVIDLTFAFSCPDDDTDTYYAAWCGGTDCNDSDAALYLELAGYADNDGDSYSTGDSVLFCTNGTLPAGYIDTQASADCDDNNADINPGATETECNGVDEDCSGSDFCVVEEDDGSRGGHRGGGGGFVYSPPKSEEEECRENWACDGWIPDECPESGKQTRNCDDLNDCGTEDARPKEERGCEYVPPEKNETEETGTEGITGAAVGTEKKSSFLYLLGIILIVLGLTGLAGLIIYWKKK